MIALILFMVAGAVPQDSVDEKVAKLLEKLRSDDIELREAATADLIALGQPAVETLRRAAGAADAEFAARVKIIIHRIAGRLALTFSDPADRRKLRLMKLAEAAGGKPVEEAVLSALAWLARHQEVDGGWSNDLIASKFAADPCAAAGTGSSANDDGTTSLAVLAFLSAGFSPSIKAELVDPADTAVRWKLDEVLAKALDRLKSRQRKDGSMMGDTKPIYTQALATLAFCEAAALTGAKADRDVALKAVEFLLSARNPGGAWRYTSLSGDNDTSVTGWCVAALHAAKSAGLWTPEKPVPAGVVGWLDSVTNKGDFRAGYNRAGTGKVFVPGKNEKYAHHETMTAISILSRRLLQGEGEDAAIRDAGVAFLVLDPPDPGPGQVDGYYWFWASQALHRIDGPDGKRWPKWYGKLLKSLLHLQVAKGCQEGSWDSDVDRWGFEGGRSGVTALNAVALMTPIR